MRPGKAVILLDFGLKRAAPGESTPPRLVKSPPTKTPTKLPSFFVKEHMSQICASADERFVRMPFGSGVKMDEPWRRVISDCPSYSYSDTPSKSPVTATRPSEDKSRSGSGTASKVKACAIGKVARSVDEPAAAGPNNEDTLIVPGATTGRSDEQTPMGVASR